MTEQNHNSEGLVQKITVSDKRQAREIKEELSKKNVNFTKLYSKLYGCLLLFIGIIWFLPFIARYSQWEFLDFFAQLPTFDFSLPVIIVCALFFAAAIWLEINVSLIRTRSGGCSDLHETILIIREGPYKIIRHPGHLAEMIYLGMLPVLLCKWIPFTITAIGAIIMLIAGYSYMIRDEDRFNIKKWGDNYRKYMNEVPAINFINGSNWLRK